MNISDLYSFAAYEFPQSANWMPKWLTKHKAFEQVKGSRIFKVFQAFGLNDFRESFEEPSILEDFKDFLISNITDVIRHAMAKKHSVTTPNKTEALQLEQVAYKLAQELMKDSTWSQQKHRITSQVVSDDKTFRIDAGTSVVKTYNIVRNKAAQLGISIPDVETSKEFRQYSRRGTFSVVFSTDPKDIAAMSSRSNWESCQTLKTDEGLNACVIGSTLSKFIGIAYITTGRDMNNRGEEMIARCLIRFAIDTTTNKPSIIIDKMYPEHNEKFIRAIYASLRKRTSIPIHNVSEFKYDDTARFRIPQENIQALPEHQKSYIDVPEIFSTKQLVSNPVAFARKYITNIADWLTIKLIGLNEAHNKSQDKYDADVFSYNVRIATKRIIMELIRIPGLQVANHYKNNKKPLPISRIEELFYNELTKTTHKVKIAAIINDTLNMISKSERINIVNYIYYQLLNIPEHLTNSDI